MPGSDRELTDASLMVIEILQASRVYIGLSRFESGKNFFEDLVRVDGVGDLRRFSQRHSGLFRHSDNDSVQCPLIRSTPTKNAQPLEAHFIVFAITKTR